MLKWIVLVLLGVTVYTGLAQDFERELKSFEDLAYDDSARFHSAIEKMRSLAGSSPAKKARIEIEIANHYYYQGNFRKADSIFRIAERIAPVTEFHLKNKARVRRAIMLTEQGEHKKAEGQLRKLASEFRSSNDLENLVEAYNSLAQIKADHGAKRDSALYYYNLALKSAREGGTEYQQAILLNNIGLVKIDLDREDEALDDFFTALQFCEKTGKERLKAHVINNIGLIYLRQEKYEKAIPYFEDFLKSSRHYPNSKEIGIAYINLGGIYHAQKMYEKSKVYFDSALHHFQMINGIPYLAKALNAVGVNHIMSEDYSTAIQYFDSSMVVSSSNELLFDYMQSHRLKARAFDSLRMFDSAIYYYKETNTLNDSLNKLSYDKAVADMATQYDLQEKEHLLSLEKSKSELHAKKEKIERIRRNIAIGSGLALVLVIFLVMYLRHARITRKKQEEFSLKLLGTLEDERNRIAKELHDDLGQRLSMIKSKVDATPSLSSNDKELFESSLTHAIDRTRKISQELYPSYLKKVDFTSAIQTLIDRTEKSTNLTCSHRIELGAFEPNETQKLHFFRIIQELISNTLKHANATAIQVTIQSDEGRLSLSYRDNGNGFKHGNKLTGMGLMSIRERVRMLGGTVTFSGTKDQGFTALVKLDDL